MVRLTDKKVKNYWDEKARKEGMDPRVTIQDHQFRELQLDVVRAYLNKKDLTLDVGCGNGYSTIFYAGHVKDIVGVDYSEDMVRSAWAYLKSRPSQPKNIKYRCADARNLPFDDSNFDKVIMERCLINIPDREGQKRVVLEAKRALKPRGMFLLSEVTLQGHKNINRLRNMFGLANIKVHWHNTYLDENTFIPFLKRHFVLVDILRFGMYGLISKIIHPLLVAPEEPRFDAKINEIARIIGRRFINFEDASHQVLFVLKRRPR